MCCEKLLAMANKRVKNLAMDGKFEPSDAYERAIIGENINLQDFISLTDADVFSHLYSWRHNNDPILADLSGRIIARKLLKVVERNNLVSGGESLILQTWKNQDKMKSLVKGLKLDPEYYLILEEEGIEAYKPYGAAMKDKEDAIFTTEEKDIEDYIRPPKEYRVWYFFVPNGIESEVEKLLG